MHAYFSEEKLQTKFDEFTKVLMSPKTEPQKLTLIIEENI